MNGRVLLLVVVTGLFMTAWDGDQAAMQSAMARRGQPQATQVATVTTDRAVSGSRMPAPRHLLTASADDVGKTATAAKTDSALDDAQTVPLPDGIAAGIYQAVNLSGKTVRVTVTEARATGHAHREFYVADSQDGDRWYLIRVAR